MATILGAKIKALRKKKKYTLEKLAKLTDSSKSYIWQLENRAPPRPSAEKILKISRQLGVTIDYLLDEQARNTVEKAADAEFYRRYQKIDESIKTKVRAFMDLLCGDE